ncbi:MAG TPA: NAD(P)-binding domain-containing protein [Methylomirabilota bacterium]|nr:NAD(P)-binding domain-containing protein [Methylomirabilota bacterium]
MDTIGFIGLGRMGRPMAANLRKKGFALVVHDVNPEPVRALEALGARAANGAAGVAQASDVVITMLPSSVEVEATVLGPDGILANGRSGQIVLDMSTVEPQTTDRLAAAAAARGMTVVDAPVGRLAAHADRGESLFMVGGSEADFARVRPLLEAMGTTIHHCGKVGSGIRTKLVNNYLAIVSCQLNAEALALAQRFGLDLGKTLEVIHGTTATNGQLRINWPNKVLAGDTTAGFTIDLAHKDLSLIIAAAETAQVPVPVAAAAREMFTAARARGYGRADFSAVLDALCELAGVDKPRLPARQG